MLSFGLYDRKFFEDSYSIKENSSLGSKRKVEFFDRVSQNQTIEKHKNANFSENT